MRNKALLQDKSGLTLVEILVYIALLALILTTLVSYALNLVRVRAKNLTISHVEQNAQLVMSAFQDAARHAEGVNTGSSVFGSDPGTLSLDMVDAGIDPRIFSLTADDGALQISDAGASAVQVTTDHVSVTNLTFTDLTSSDDLGMIRVEFTITTDGGAGDPIFFYEEDFQTTVRIPLDL